MSVLHTAYLFKKGEGMFSFQRTWVRYYAVLYDTGVLALHHSPGSRARRSITIAPVQPGDVSKTTRGGAGEFPGGCDLSLVNPLLLQSPEFRVCIVPNRRAIAPTMSGKHQRPERSTRNHQTCATGLPPLSSINVPRCFLQLRLPPRCDARPCPAVSGWLWPVC